MSNDGMSLVVEKSKLRGEITIPSSKSQVLRAIVFGALAKGKSHITNILDSPDTEAMIDACRCLGASIVREGDSLIIEGSKVFGGGTIDVGNSGLVLRLVGGIAALGNRSFTLTGDESIRTRRVVKPLIEGLQQLGATAECQNGFAPICVQGPLQGGHAKIQGADSQPVSALLIASAFAKGPSQLHVENAGETPWVALTLSWFQRLGIPYKAHGFTSYELEGHASIDSFTYSVPGDVSSAAFPLVGALITHSSITIKNVDLTDPQGDKKLFFLLQELGARLVVEKNEIHVFPSSLRGGKIDINECIDALPILTVLGCFATDPIEIVNGAIARCKESDRIKAITGELKKMGANIIEREDGLIVFPSKLKGATLFSHHDHRIAMALAVAGFNAEGKTRIEETVCVAKTFPHFSSLFKQLGGNIESHPMRLA